ncbi:MAG: hypothetical protein ABI140_20425, partial [Jatrophihabitantaceae bacterium]
MTDEHPDPPRRRRAVRTRPPVLLGIDPLRPIEALRTLDGRAKPNLKRAVPAVLVALISFGFGDHLGGIDQTRATRFAMFGHALNLSKSQASLLVL